MWLHDESELHAMGYRVSPDDPNAVIPFPARASSDMTIAELEDLATPRIQGSATSGETGGGLLLVPRRLPLRTS